MSDEKAKEDKDNINSLCKKLFTPQLCSEPVTESKRILEIKLIKQMELFSNYLWGKGEYKNLNLPSVTLYNSNLNKEKEEIATKVQAIDMTIAICFDSWKKTPLQNTNGYTNFFMVTFNNTLNKIVEEDTKIFTYVPESVKENDIRLSKECKIRNMDNYDSAELEKLALEIGIYAEEYKAVCKWRSIKKTVSIETPIGKKEDDEELEDKLEDVLEDDNTLSSDKKYIVIETGKRILRFINTIFRMKERDEWWKSLVTGIFFDLLHSFFALSEESIERYEFIDKKIYNLPERPSQKQIAELLGKDTGQLSKAAGKFLKLCTESITDFHDLKNDYDLQASLKEYLVEMDEKGKHKNRSNE